MEWINRNVEKLPRNSDFPYRVKMLYFCRQQPNKHKTPSTPPDMFEISIHLSSTAEICNDKINGVVIQEHFPNMVRKEPGQHHVFYTDSLRDSIAFGYSVDLIEKFKELGMYPDRIMFSFEMTPEIEKQVNEFRQLCQQLYAPGVMDRLDWLCFKLYREVLVFNSQKPPAVTEVDKFKNISVWFQIHFAESIDLDQVARINGFSRVTFFRKWKRLFHVSPVQYILNLKIETAEHLLRETDMSINSIVHEINFSGTTAFHKRFFQKHGMTPNEYRQCHLLADLPEN